ncbi:MAG: glutamate-5-semialdehyde dehydrogenase [Bacillota bacterium]
MSIKQEVVAQANKAQQASRKLSNMSAESKNQALQSIAERLEDSMDKILEANRRDMAVGRENDLSQALLDRLKLTEDRIQSMARGLREIVQLEDPIGEIPGAWRRPNGLDIARIRVPLGVVGIIYEARPNVTVDVAGLCLKSGNAVVLRGGSNAINSNRILTEIITSALEATDIPGTAVQLIQTTDREAVEVLFGLNEYLDVLIPRGGPGLINRVVNESKVPVIETGVGNCHVYVEETADLEMALKIIDNAKTDRPAVCNAAESLLVDRGIADRLLPRLGELFADRVELRGDEEVQELLPEVTPASDEDWGREYLDYILAVKVVPGVDEAVEHIYRYGSKHSEAIVTNDYTKANYFLKEIDAAAVYVNASTRFTDGGQFGLGAETGISTQKLHARGPMGLKELTTTKYIIRGQGQVR